MATVKDPEQSNARSAIILVVVIVIIAIYSSAYGMQTLQWFAAHQWASINPWLRDVPKALPPPPALPPTPPPPTPGHKAIAVAASGTELTAYNYEFNVPWTGKFKETPSAGGAQFKFDSGQIVVFGDPEAQLDTLEILRTSTTGEYAPFQALVNEAGISTNYALYQAVYSASPANARPLMAYAAAQRERVLLLTKLSFGFDVEGDIHSFEFGDNKGFEFGNPALGPVAVRVFNARDHQFRFLFTEFTGTDALITQNDIDQAIQTLQVEPFETK
jgi:hypothetical protein